MSKETTPAAADPAKAVKKRAAPKKSTFDFDAFEAEIETTELRVGNAFFNTLDRLGIGHHTHYPVTAKEIASRVGAANKKFKDAPVAYDELENEVEPKHFIVKSVDDKDEKGAGVRVIRDK